MKKLTVFVVFSLILIALLAANGHKEDSSTPQVEGLLQLIKSECTCEVYDGDKRVIEVKDGTLSPDGATFIYKNLEEYDLCYWEAFYYIEVQIKGKWYVCVDRDDRCYELATRYLAPGQEKERELVWYYYYGSLPPGNYRLIQSFSEMIGLDSNVTIACEFTVE